MIAHHPRGPTWFTAEEPLALHWSVWTDGIGGVSGGRVGLLKELVRSGWKRSEKWVTIEACLRRTMSGAIASHCREWSNVRAGVSQLGSLAHRWPAYGKPGY